MLPELEDKNSTGTESFSKLFELSDPKEKIGPAYELERQTATHARLHPYVRLDVPAGQDQSEAWLDSAFSRYRHGVASLSPSERAALVPPEAESVEMFFVAKDMLRTSGPILLNEERGAYVVGYLAMVAAHCAFGGKSHYDYFFDRDRNGNLPSAAVLAAVRKYAAERQLHVEYKHKILHEQEMSKAKYASIHRQLLEQSKPVPEDSMKPEAKASSRSSTTVTVWPPSVFKWNPVNNAADKAGPKHDYLKIMRGYYEAIGSMRSDEPGCSYCGLKHDAKTICHWHKFPAYRSLAFKRGYDLALKNGYFKDSAVDEWNSRKGREEGHKCGPDGKHPSYPKAKHLRRGMADALP
mmetsp:Transcript_14219/g.19754  ORF Transcript_14219/g.19754 Transcript_14219/m.19754 type:complete len:352 (-) Transcript_14219:1652-2707(-)